MLIGNKKKTKGYDHLHALVNFVVSGLNVEPEISYKEAFEFLICGKEGVPAPKNLAQFIDYLKDGAGYSQGYEQFTDHDPYFTVPKRLKKSSFPKDIRQALHGGRKKKAQQSISEEEIEAAEEQYSQGRTKRSRQDAKDVLEAEQARQRGAAAEAWSQKLTNIQDARFASAVANSKKFDKALFEPYKQFLELKKRTLPVPPVQAYINAAGVTAELSNPLAYAGGSIILVTRWNGNTQVIIPSGGASTLLSKRRGRFNEGLPTWFPIAEFISRWDLQPYAFEYGGDITSLAQAYRFSFTWRTHKPKHEKYLLYPVHMFTETSKQGPDDKAGQALVTLEYIGTAEPPVPTRYRMADGGKTVADRIRDKQVDLPPMGAEAAREATMEDFNVDPGAYEKYNNPYRRRNHGTHVRALPQYEIDEEEIEMDGNPHYNWS